MTNPYEYDLPVDDLIARYRETYSSAVYDVLDKRGMPNQALAVDIKPVKLEWKLAGPAFTMKGVSDPTGNEELRQRRILMFDAMKETGVPIIDVRDCSFDTQVAHYGEMNATVGASCGVIGAIIDGGSRDTQFLIDRDFPIFARYLSPVEALMRWTYYDWQIPIGLRGALNSIVPVSPGDFMVGDLDGVIVVPREHVVSVLLETEELIEHENVVREEFATGDDPVETYKRHALL